MAEIHYPAEWVEQVRLNDGLELRLRPIRPDDAAALQESFTRLSPQSVYLRFFEVFKQLPDKMAHEFANLDYCERMAFVAELDEGGDDNVIGVARYALVGDDDPGMAEAAVVVIDAFQGRGLGSLLLDRLVRYARANGVSGFVATIHTSNAPMLGIVKRSQYPVERKMLEPGVWQARISLERRQR